VPRNPISREEFAKQVAAALREEGAEGEFEFDAIENRLVHASRAPFPLEEHFLEAQGQPAYLIDQLARAYAHLHLRPPTQPSTWGEARRVVFPYVRPMAFHAHRGFRALQGEVLPAVPFGTVTEHVTVCIGTPTKWKTLVADVEDLKRWDVSTEGALDAARENVERRGNPDWLKANEYPGVFRSPWKDEYGISRILFRGAFGRIPLRGDPVIIAPTWQSFLVAGSDDEQGLVNLGLLGRKIAEKDNFLIYRPLRARGDALEHWLPPKGHTAHQPLRFLQLANECGDYAEQAQVGRRFFERKEQASNIPVPQVCSLHGGAELGTIATWRDGPPCALPRVDYVALKRKSENLGVAKWADVQRAVGSELKPLNVYPPRWLARSFPADWQLAAMDLTPFEPRPGTW
jgi:hypothetical protein